MITSYMIFVNQKYYAWVLIYLTNKINFVIGQTERLFDYQATNQKQISKQNSKQISKQNFKANFKAKF